jgi:hypothetical protein
MKRLLETTPGRFYLEAEVENVLSIVCSGDGVNIEVSQEEAVDSYNQNFNSAIHLVKHEAEALRDWLLEYLPK